VALESELDPDPELESVAGVFFVSVEPSLDPASEDPPPLAPSPVERPSPVEPPPSPFDAPAPARARVLLLDDERSFFAQPDPLKWTAGVVSALRSVPSAPQFGQNFGPGSLMPWITSVRCRQVAQT